MATDLKRFSKARLFVNGTEALMMTDVSITQRGNHIEQKVMSVGLAGIATGSPEVEIQFTSAVPVDGFENNVSEMIETGDFVQLTILSGASSCTSAGWFTESSLEGSTDQADTYRVSFKGVYAKFE